MHKHTRKPLTTLFILILLALTVIATGCEKVLPKGCREVTFQPNAGWQYDRGVWTNDLGQLVGIAGTEDSYIVACADGLQ